MVAVNERSLSTTWTMLPNSLGRHGRRDRCARCVETPSGPGVSAGQVNYIYYDSQWQAIEPRTGGTVNSAVTSPAKFNNDCLYYTRGEQVKVEPER